MTEQQGSAQAILSKVGNQKSGIPVATRVSVDQAYLHSVSALI